MGSVYRKRSRGKDLGWYVAFVDSDGSRKHIPSRQPSRKEALVLLAEVEARVRRGAVGVPIPEEGTRLTVGDVVQRYLDEYSSPRLKDRERRMRNCRTIFKRLMPLFGKLPIVELTSQRLAKARDTLAQHLQPNTVLH